MPMVKIGSFWIMVIVCLRAQVPLNGQFGNMIPTCAV